MFCGIAAFVVNLLASVHTAGMSDASEPTVSVDRAALRAFLIELLDQNSVFPNDAELIADVLLHAHAVGEPASGLPLLPHWIRLIGEGQIDPRGKPLPLAEAPALLTLDGSSAPGPIGMKAAVDWAIATSRETGAAVAIVKNGRDAGWPDYYITLISTAGLLGIVQSSGYRQWDDKSYCDRFAALPADGPCVAYCESFREPASDPGGDPVFRQPLNVMATLLANGRTPMNRQSAPNPHQCEHFVIVVDPERGLGRDTVARCCAREYGADESGAVEPSDTIAVPVPLLDRLSELAAAVDVATPW